MKKVNKLRLLENWEAIHRQGMLMFWVCAALKKSPSAVDDLQKQVATLTDGQFDVAEQSLYRLLNKQLSRGLVEYQLQPSRKGPNKKIWRLTKLGKKVYKEFVAYNIKPLKEFTD